MSDKVRITLIVTLGVLLLVVVGIIIIKQVNKVGSDEVGYDLEVEMEYLIDENVESIEEITEEPYEEEYEEEYEEDEGLIEVNEVQLRKWDVVNTKRMIGLQKYGNYKRIYDIPELSDVPSFVGVVDGAEILYAGTLDTNPYISAFITNVPALDMYESYFEALRRCGFSDLKLAKYYGYMCLGDKHTLFMRKSVVSVEVDGDYQNLGEMTVVLVADSVDIDVVDKSKAFDGYEIGVFDEIVVIPYE